MLKVIIHVDAHIPRRPGSDSPTAAIATIATTFIALPPLYCRRKVKRKAATNVINAAQNLACIFGGDLGLFALNRNEGVLAVPGFVGWRHTIWSPLTLLVASTGTTAASI